ncbi:MAG: hypothetical protein ACRCXA_06595 [Peptostreptococcaceae bacterium]
MGNLFKKLTKNIDLKGLKDGIKGLKDTILKLKKRAIKLYNDSEFWEKPIGQLALGAGGGIIGDKIGEIIPSLPSFEFDGEKDKGNGPSGGIGSITEAFSLDQIEEIKGAFENLKSTISQIESKLNDTSEAMKSLATVMIGTSLVSAMGVGILIAALMAIPLVITFVSGTVGKLALAIVSVIGIVIEAVISTTMKLIELVVKIIGLIAKVFTIIISALAEGVKIIVGAIVKAIVMLAEAIGTIVGILAKVFGIIISTLAEGVKIIIGAIVKAIVMLAEAIGTIVGILAKVFETLVSTIVNVLKMIVVTLIPAIAKGIMLLIPVFAKVIVILAGVIGVLALAIGALVLAFAGLPPLLKAIESSISNISDSINGFGKDIVSKFEDSMDTLVESAQNSFDKVSEIFRKEIRPNIKLPYISIDGQFSGNPLQAPKFRLNWYQTGGIFTGPSVIGVGENGDEAVLPLSNKRRMKPFANAVASMIGVDNSNKPSNQGVTINIDNMAVRNDMDIKKIAEELNRLTLRENRKLGLI